MALIDEARKLRIFIKENAHLLTDEAATEMIYAFDKWAADSDYKKDDRIRFNEKLYKCLTDHKAQSDWPPDAAPSIWAEVLPGQDGDVGEWVQPDSTNPYMKGDKVTHNGITWISDVDNNVWEPGVYGWTQYIA